MFVWNNNFIFPCVSYFKILFSDIIQEKMDLKQDMQLLTRINVEKIKRIRSQLHQKEEWEKKYNELKQSSDKEIREQFRVITEQAEVIRQYRCIILELSPELLSPSSSDTPPPISTISSPSSSSSSPKVILSTPQPSEPPQKPDNNVNTGSKNILKHLGKRSSDVLTAPASSATSSLATGVKTRERKIRKIYEIKEQQKIKLPTENDGYPDLLTGQLIWNTILRCFQKSHGNMVREDDIIAECGKCLLTNMHEPFLDKKKITQFFTFPFKFKDNDRSMTVREYPLSPDSHEKSWIVLMPDWFSIED